MGLESRSYFWLALCRLYAILIPAPPIKVYRSRSTSASCIPPCETARSQELPQREPRASAMVSKHHLGTTSKRGPSRHQVSSPQQHTSATDPFLQQQQLQLTSHSLTPRTWKQCQPSCLLLLSLLIAGIGTFPTYAARDSSCPTSILSNTEVVSTARYVPGTEYHFNGAKYRIGSLRIRASYTIHTEAIGYDARGEIMSSYECPPIRRNHDDPIGSWESWTTEEKQALDEQDYAAVKCETSCNGWAMRPFCMSDCGVLHCAVLRFPKDNEKMRIYRLQDGETYISVSSDNTPFETITHPAHLGCTTITIQHGSTYPHFIVVYKGKAYAMTRSTGYQHIDDLPVYRKPGCELWKHRSGLIEMDYDAPHHKWYSTITHPRTRGYLIPLSTDSNDTHYIHEVAIKPPYLTFTAPQQVIRESTNPRCNITHCRDVLPTDNVPHEVSSMGVYTLYVEVNGTNCEVDTGDGKTLHIDKAEVITTNSKTLTSLNTVLCSATVSADEERVNHWHTNPEEGGNVYIKMDSTPLAEAWATTLTFVSKIGGKILPIAFACVVVYASGGSLYPTLIAMLIVGATFVVGADAAPLDHNQLVAEYTISLTYATLSYLEIPSRTLLTLAICSAAILGPMRRVPDVAESFTIILIATSKYDYFLKVSLIIMLMLGSFRKLYSQALVKAFNASREAANDLRSLNTIPLNKLAHLYRDSGRTTIPADFVGNKVVITKPRHRRRKPYSPLQSKCNRRRLISSLFYPEELQHVKKHLDTLATSELILLQQDGCGVHARQPGKITELFRHVQDPPDWARDLILTL
nr:ORF1 [Ailanthus flavi-like virus]